MSRDHGLTDEQFISVVWKACIKQFLSNKIKLANLNFI